MKKGSELCGGESARWTATWGECASVGLEQGAEWAHSYSHIPLYSVQVSRNDSRGTRLRDSCPVSSSTVPAARVCVCVCVGGRALLLNLNVILVPEKKKNMTKTHLF